MVDILKDKCVTEHFHTILWSYSTWKDSSSNQSVERHNSAAGRETFVDPPLFCSHWNLMVNEDASFVQMIDYIFLTISYDIHRHNTGDGSSLVTKQSWMVLNKQFTGYN